MFEGNIAYAKYSTFEVAGEGDKYRLLIDGHNVRLETRWLEDTQQSKKPDVSCKGNS